MARRARPDLAPNLSMSAITRDVAELDRMVRFRDFWTILPLWLVAVGQVVGTRPCSVMRRCARLWICNGGLARGVEWIQSMQSSGQVCMYSCAANVPEPTAGPRAERIAARLTVVGCPVHI